MLLMLQNQILQEKAAGRGLKRNPAHFSVQTQDQQCLRHFDGCSPNLFVKPSNVEGFLMCPASLDYSYHYKVFVFPNDPTSLCNLNVLFLALCEVKGLFSPFYVFKDHFVFPQSFLPQTNHSYSFNIPFHVMVSGSVTILPGLLWSLLPIA